MSQSVAIRLSINFKYIYIQYDCSCHKMSVRFLYFVWLVSPTVFSCPISVMYVVKFYDQVCVSSEKPMFSVGSNYSYIVSRLNYKIYTKIKTNKYMFLEA